MSVNVNVNNNLANEEEVRKFLNCYNDMVKYISENHLMDYIEETYKLTFSSELNGTMVGRLNNILVRLFDSKIEHVETLNKFMQVPNLNFSNKGVSNSQINARLKKLRDVYFEFMLMYNSMVSDPFNVSGAVASLQESSPNINLTLSRNDLAQFNCTLNFNSLLTLIVQLVSTADNKLKAGNNAIDIQLLNKYIEAANSFSNVISEFKKSKDIK